MVQSPCTRRPEAFLYLKERNWDGLRRISQAHLTEHLAKGPANCLFVAPGISVVSPNPSPAFFAEAEKRCSEWHACQFRVFGNRAKHDLASQADWATRMLVFNGTLAVGGDLYLPGRWPNRVVSVAWRRSPPFFATRTVPPEYLGLTGRTSVQDDICEITTP